jgi:hypothetical protein
MTALRPDFARLFTFPFLTLYAFLLLGENTMTTQNYLLNAIETVLSWDIAEELIPLAINDQAKLLAGFDAEDLWISNLD